MTGPPRPRSRPGAGARAAAARIKPTRTPHRTDWPGAWLCARPGARRWTASAVCLLGDSKGPVPLITRRDAQGGRRPGGPAASAVGAEPPQHEALQRGPGEAPGGRSDQQRIDDPHGRVDVQVGCEVPGGHTLAHALT